MLRRAYGVIYLKEMNYQEFNEWMKPVRNLLNLKNEMMKKNIIILSIGMIFLLSCSNDKRVVLPIDETISRVAKDKASLFETRLIEKENGLEHIEIKSEGEKVVISGSSQNAIGYAFNWYLKNYLNNQFAKGVTNVQIPDQLPPLDGVVNLSAPFQMRYYLNYCTYNYSMSWWTWEDWERELDFMALHGINMPLAVLGYEKVYYNTLMRLGYSESEILDFVPGPGYTAWWLMGNLQGYGGRVSKAWIDQQAEIQQKVVSRMRALDMKPVFHGFYGMMPVDAADKFPDNKFINSGTWASFERPLIIDPTDTLFQYTADIYYEELEKLYGQAEYYGGDPFHEGASGANVDLAEAGKIIQQTMIDQYPNADWVLQNWDKNPSDYLLSGMRGDHLVVLDLFGETKPGWRTRGCFGDKKWIWCSINNFGNKVGIHGKPDSIAIAPIAALNIASCSRNLIGIGTIMEGSDYNASNYELTYDMAWRSTSPKVSDWFSSYAKSRYGGTYAKADSSWQLLYQSSFAPPSSQEEQVEPLICARPSLEVKHVATWGSTNIHYDPSNVQRAAKYLLSCSEALADKETFRYDLVDVTRQAMSDLAHVRYEAMVEAYLSKDREAFDRESKSFIALQYDLDRLLLTRGEFSLWKWIDDARNIATSKEESDLFEFNARRLITLWGTEASSGSLHDYAAKLWGGMIATFYTKRWEMFVAGLSEQFDGKPLAAAIDFYGFEDQWTKQSTPATQAITTGDEVSVATFMINKYFP